MMGGSALREIDRSTAWLAGLIEATEVVTTSAEPCEPAIMTAFRHRLAVHSGLQSLLERSPPIVT